MAKASSRGGQRTIPPVFNELNDKLWWDHKKYTNEELHSIDNYLQEVSKDPHFTSDLYANLKTLYKGLGLHPHPFLNYPLKKTLPPEVLANIQQAIAQAEAANAAAKKGAPLVEKPEIPECEVLQINNIKLDAVVLKLLAYVWAQSKLSTIKLTRNQMEGYIEEVLIDVVSNPTFKLNKLFIDWNPPINFQLYTKILNNPNIQFLSLRSNNLNDDALGTLCAALKDNISLKSIDLYGNQITGAGIAHLAGLIETSCALEYIGLAKNSLGKWSDVKDWLDNLGKFPLTNEEVEEYRQKEKDKEAAIQKNQKNKGKKGYVEDPVPFLYPIAQAADGNWFMLKGVKIRLVSLALNNFDADSLPGFNQLLSRQDDDFCLVLSNNPINKKDIEPLQQKHKNKLVF